MKKILEKSGKSEGQKMGTMNLLLHSVQNWKWWKFVFK